MIYRDGDQALLRTCRILFDQAHWQELMLNLAKHVHTNGTRQTQSRDNAQILSLSYLISHLDKMATIFADDIFRCISMNEMFWISIRISLNFVPKGQSDNKSALVQEMACRLTGDKPLPEPMRTQFTDA